MAPAHDTGTQTSTTRPVRMVFTSRAGGTSSSPYDSFNLGDHVGDDPDNVAANRHRLADVLGVPSERFVWMEQLHTNTATVVDGPRPEPVEATDALVTTERNLALCVLVADCTPVLLSDHHAGVIAAVHAGRMGARNGIVRNTVDAMVKLGARPAAIQALLGPAAAGESYEVPRQMAQDVEKHLPGSMTRTAKGTTGLDIRAGVVRQLLECGITHIDADPRDTVTDADFFSYRREGTTGRQAGVIWLTDEAGKATND
ncbi:peptidoglycan editing factor PgeF [Corynebacterium sp. LK2510]|uniref:peptidoglycan editing factor PgeF n=1 Tax=Corynebacterium sp. LK2510 TaxID=3110472 RepID=UPI0034CE5592